MGASGETLEPPPVLQHSHERILVRPLAAAMQRPAIRMHPLPVMWDDHPAALSCAVSRDQQLLLLLS